MSLNLVAYDSSDNESSSEQEDIKEETKAIIISRTPAANISIVNDDEDVTDLPKPSEKERELAELAKKEKANLCKVDDLQKLSLKKNGKVIIGIPSLADLEDEKDENEKKTKKLHIPIQKGQSRLFAKLPAPKNSEYVPQTEEASKLPPVTGKPPAPIKKSVPLIPQSVMRREAKKDSDDEDDSSGNFFTLDEPALPAISVPFNLQSSTQKNPSVAAYKEESTAFPAIPTNHLYNMAGMVDSGMPQPTYGAQMELDDTALEALQGTSGLKRKLPEDAQIIDIKQEKLTYDPNMSYVKAISEEQNPSGGEEFTYNKLQKKKHQITWLAAQAKAREVELKNQWAANRNTRKQTQAKYGF